MTSHCSCAPQVIRSIEGLQALPVASVVLVIEASEDVREPMALVWVRDSDTDWVEAGSADRCPADEINLPVRVLWTPAGTAWADTAETTTDASIKDCSVDPGPLGRVAAVRALSIHHACPDQCHPRRRASATIDAAYVARPLHSCSEDDARLAELLHEGVRLMAEVGHEGPRSTQTGGRTRIESATTTGTKP